MATLREHVENAIGGAVAGAMHLDLTEARHVITSIITGVATATIIGLGKWLLRRAPGPFRPSDPPPPNKA